MRILINFANVMDLLDLMLSCLLYNNENEQMIVYPRRSLSNINSLD